jgi:ATP-dependent DNA helicase PIF1
MQHNEPDCKRARREEEAPPPADTKQRQILDLCLSGRNVFLTGVGGTGKTFLLLQIAEAMRVKYGKKRVVVTASTGVAAVQVEGQTLHSITGAGVPNVVSDFEKCHKFRNEWRQLACLIVDEVSLIEPSYLDWLDSAVRGIRRDPSHAFGGIQLIWSGDFLQLPGICKGVTLAAKCPVLSDPNPANIPIHVDQFQSYVFQTVCWQDAGFAIAELTTIFRQSEARMISALLKIRRGVVDDDVKAFVAACAGPLSEDDEIKPTILYSRNKDVELENQTNLKALPSDPEEFVARDAVFPDDGTPAWVRGKLLGDAFFKNGQVPERVVLKIGAQVLLTKNLDKILVNGSRGVVKYFMTKDKSIEDLTNRISLCTDDTVRVGLVNQLETVKASPPAVSYPVVLFHNGQQMLCTHVEFKHRVWNAGECKRFQVPLRLAWSLTIHRCQGSSLDRVQVDLSGCFSPGQCYVALSRARTSVGLQVVGFTENAVKSNPLAVGFHDAVTEGVVDKFMVGVPFWFEPVLKDGIDQNWRKLFESSNVFRGWVERVRK